MRTQGTLRELFLDLTLFDARALSQPRFDLRWAVANDWNAPMHLVRGGVSEGAQFLDEQADSLTLAERFPWSLLLGGGPRALPGSARPLAARLSTQLEGRLTLHWGGWTDRPIEAWHSLTAAFNYQREHYPRNELFLFQSDSKGQTFFITRPTLAVGDVVLRNAFLLAEGAPGFAGLAAWGLSLRLDLKLPVGKLARLGGSGGVDVGLALQGSRQLKSTLTLHGQLGLLRLGPLAADALLQNNRWMGVAEASLAWTVGRATLLFEDRVSTALFASGWERSPFGGNDGYLSSGLAATFRAHNQLTFAARLGRFTLWLSEDFTPGPNPHSTLPILYVSNAPDVVLGLSYTHEQ